MHVGEAGKDVPSSIPAGAVFVVPQTSESAAGKVRERRHLVAASTAVGLFGDVRGAPLIYVRHDGES